MEITKIIIIILRGESIIAKTIFLDPGHGGADPGAVNGRRYEKTDNLRIAGAVREKLKARGHTVLMTREEDEYNPSLSARIAVANSARADLFLSLHRNSFNTKEANGIEIWVRYPAHAAAAAILLEELAKCPNQSNRGVKTGDYLVLYNAAMPAMLLELGFISNELDNELFDNHLDIYAESIARGILLALGEEYQRERSPAKTALACADRRVREQRKRRGFSGSCKRHGAQRVYSHSKGLGSVSTRGT